MNSRTQMHDVADNGTQRSENGDPNPSSETPPVTCARIADSVYSPKHFDKNAHSNPDHPTTLTGWFLESDRD